MMNFRSSHEPASVGVVLSNPLLGKNDIGDDIHLFPNSYNHKVIANGGFWDAQIGITGDIVALLPSIHSVIGLDVSCISKQNNKVWQGFVNSVSVNAGIASFTIGPLMDVRNNLSVVYQTTRYNTIPPIGGQQRRLPALLDEGSSERYGIIGYELSGGTGDSVGALALQQTHLDENKTPRVQQSLSIGSVSTSAVSVNLQCLGYVHLLDKFIYNINVAGYQTTREKIQAVLDAEPNGLFSNMIFSGSNLVDVPVVESGATGWAVIKSAVSVGDELANRYIFGVRENLNAYYQVVGTDYTYYLRPDGSVHDESGRVDAWDIRAGVWLDASSIITGSPITGEIGSRVSDVFIESVSYTAPSSASIEGGRVDRSVQQLAQRGVGGSF